MSRFWSPGIDTLTPYIPGEQPAGTDLVKLNTNEHPYGPPPGVADAVARACADLRLYPDPEATPLRQLLAQQNELDVAQVFIGNGSDEVLAHLFYALLRQSKPVYLPAMTYSFYPVWARLYGVELCTVPLREDMSLALQDFPLDNGGIIFANPNAPTGLAVSRAEVELLLQRNTDSVVVVDEAYVAFGAESAVPLVSQYSNLLVVQTLSKSHGLAGLRVGMAMGDAQLIEALYRVKNSFNSYPVDRLAQAGALAAVSDTDWLVQNSRRVVDAREGLATRLRDKGFIVLPSQANFLLVSHASAAAEGLFQKLRQRGIIVRYFDRPELANHLRITVGTEPQCELLLTALEEILAEAPGN